MNATRSVVPNRTLRWGVPLVLALGAATLAGCTDARFVDVWRDQEWSGRPLHAVLVVSQRGDDIQRRLWEDAIAGQLQRHDVDAVPSHTIFPEAPPSRSRMLESMRDRRFDATLMEKPLRPGAQTTWVPGFGTVQPREYYNPWNGRDVIVYGRRWHPGYARTDRIAREQLTLWSPDDDGRMVWAGTAEVFDPGSSDDLRRGLASRIPSALRDADLLRR